MSKTSEDLLKSWPSTARYIVLNAAKFFYRQMNEPFAVYDVHMDEAVDQANREIEQQQQYIYEEASPHWIDRWENGKTDAEIKQAIATTYDKLLRAEHGLRSHARVKAAVICKRCKGKGTCPSCGKVPIPKKKTPRQLEAEIAQAIAKRPSRAHATRKGILGSGAITEEQARTLPRFDFIAHWLGVVTRKKENRDLAKGKRVRHRDGLWQIVYSNGLVEYETPDTDRLFDYARRGPLGWHIRNAEEFRGLAYQRAAQA